MTSEHHQAKRPRRIIVRDDKARQAMLDEEFNDIYKNRKRIYRTNFFRGVFFGLGTFIGGTIVVALVVAILSWLGNTFHISPFTDLVKVVEETHISK